MYIGHAALALYARSRRPEIPLAILIPAAFAPDWIQWSLYGFNVDDAGLSHSLLSVLLCGMIIGFGYRLLANASWTDAIVLFLLVLSHWAADLVTATKALWPGGPTMGLGLYRHGVADFFVEFALVVVCWMRYVVSIPNASRHRATTWLAPVGLALMHVGFLTLTTNLI